ncbi:MAG: transglycosylase SLT domain-containing protein [Candidatus Kryptoniota bacterium]
MDRIQQVNAAHRNLTEEQKTKLKAAVKGFEAIFDEYMLKSMQETEKIDDNGDKDEGFGKDIMTGLFNIELSEFMAKNSNLGIASMLYKQFTGEDLNDGIKKISLNEPLHSAGFGKVNANSSDSLLENVGKYSDIIDEAAGIFGLKSSLIKAVIAAESAGRADSLSSKNAKGLMQLMDSTARDMGVTNPFDPRQNIMGGAKYLKSLLDKFSGNVELALASYNAGPNAVEKHGGIPPYNETRNYIRRVLSFINVFDKENMK